MKSVQPRIVLLFITFFVITLFSWNCSTKKNTFIARQYHMLTAHYNVFFNGNEALKEGVASLESKHQDNFQQILSVWREGTEKDQQGILPQMNRAEEKGYKTIALHSMEFGGTEYNKWIDDSYLLIGKANYYKGDLIKAKSIFEYVTTKYRKNLERYEAHLWLVKIALKNKNFNEAFNHLATVKKAFEDGILNKKLTKFYYLTSIDYYNQTKNFDESIQYLQKVIPLVHTTRFKARLLFILAQVYQAKGDKQKAFDTYQKVLQKSPPYDLAFHARINLALTYDPNISTRKKIDLNSTLLKMVKDKKNEEYLDEIYYALAIYELNQSNEQKALEYLRLSAKKSNKNIYQKTLTYLTLGNYLYEKKKYREAQAYYDTLITILPKDYPDRETIQQRQKLLSMLVNHLTTIEREDSLQRVARMPEQERLAFIDRLIQQYIQEEERKKQEERQRLSTLFQNNAQNLTNASSSWYFYNPQTVNFGKIEFRKRWGPRPLEDLWRLSNKQPLLTFDDAGNQTDTTTTDTSKASKNPRDRLYYLKDLPLTPEKLNQSNQRLENALFQAGYIYKTELQECGEAIPYLERHSNDFKESSNRPISLYLLYTCYHEVKDYNKANQYKNTLLNSYPESEYTRILLDTNYLTKLKNQQKISEIYYENTYLAFQNGQCDRVIFMADSAIKFFVDPVLISRFSYLRILCMGKLYGKDTLVALLKKEIKTFQQPVKKEAEQLLAFYQQESSSTQTSTSTSSNSSSVPVYMKPDEKDIHIFVCILDAKKSSSNTIKALFSDFNKQNYLDLNLSIGNIILNNERVMYSISQFKNKNDAMKYYQHVTSTTSLLNQLLPANPVIFVISATNYPTFYKIKDETEYLNFFKDNYFSP